MGNGKKRLDLQDRFAFAGAAIGRSIRGLLPDHFAATDQSVSVRSRLKLEYPQEMEISLAFQRGIADLNGIAWASIPDDVTHALDTLTPHQLGCFIGILAARARKLVDFENALPIGAKENIAAAEESLWDYYSLYPIQKMNVGFNIQTYALGMNLLGQIPEDDPLVQGAKENPYLHKILRTDSLIKDSDILGMALEDIRAFAHMISRHFKLDKTQQEAFSLLIPLPFSLPEEDTKTSDGKYKMDAGRTLQSVSRKSRDEPLLLDEKRIMAREGLDCAAQDTSKDKIIEIADLVDLSEARVIREVLENANPVLMTSAARIAQQMTKRLAGMRQDQIIRDLEDGYLDTTRLTRIITDPSASDYFYETATSPQLNAEVTLLLDNSGSMTGIKIQMAYIATLFITRALERAGIPCEVLGFTTGDDEDDEQMTEEQIEAYAKAQKKAVGRTDPLRLIIYKSFEERHIDEDKLAGMLCSHIMGMTPTGEGLLWASNRMIARNNKKRKILISIEDAQPFVSLGEATKSTSKDQLHAVIKAIEERGDIDLAAIGICHDPGKFYKNHIRVDHSEQLPRALSGLLDLLVCGERRHFNAGAFRRLTKRVLSKKPLDRRQIQSL